MRKRGHICAGVLLVQGSTGEAAPGRVSASGTFECNSDLPSFMRSWLTPRLSLAIIPMRTHHLMIWCGSGLNSSGLAAAKAPSRRSRALMSDLMRLTIDETNLAFRQIYT